MTDGASDTTIDRFLDGALTLEQPARGRHRAGLDAVLLAAAVPEGARGRVVDLGAGVGTAGLAVAARVPGVSITLADRDEEVLRLARLNAARPENAAFGGRVEVVAVDLMARGRAREAVLARESAERVICNPPFFTPHEVRASPAEARAAAHVFDVGTLDDWVRVAAATLAAKGELALIFKGDGLGEILTACEGRFGALAITPVHPRAGSAAHRLIVTAIKGSRARPSILPGLVLHPAEGNAYLAEADAILRGRRGLSGAPGLVSGRT